MNKVFNLPQLGWSQKWNEKQIPFFGQWLEAATAAWRRKAKIEFSEYEFSFFIATVLRRLFIWSFPLSTKSQHEFIFDMLSVNWHSRQSTICSNGGRGAHSVSHIQTQENFALIQVHTWRVRRASCDVLSWYYMSWEWIFVGVFFLSLFLRHPGFDSVHKFVSCIPAWLRTSTYVRLFIEFFSVHRLLRLLRSFVVLIELNSIFGLHTHHASQCRRPTSTEQRKIVTWLRPYNIYDPTNCDKFYEQWKRRYTLSLSGRNFELKVCQENWNFVRLLNRRTIVVCLLQFLVNGNAIMACVPVHVLTAKHVVNIVLFAQPNSICGLESLSSHIGNKLRFSCVFQLMKWTISHEMS